MFAFENNIISMTGNLSEEVSVDDFILLFNDQLKKNGIESNSMVKLSLESINRINSIGLKTLIKAAHAIENQIIFVNCPIWLVDFFNMIEGVFGDKHFALSLYAPFYSEEFKKEEMILIDIEKDFDLTKSFDVQEFSDVIINKVKYSPDFDSGTYLKFLLPIESRIRNYLELISKKRSKA